MSTTISTSISEEDFRDQDEKLWNDLKREFESTPTMVFSVIGDSESFVPKLWQKDVFQTALVEAAKNGGDTWILYRGAKTGVSKVVRDAYKRCTEKKHNLVQLIDIEVKNDINISETNKRVTTNLLQFEEFVSQQEYSFKMPVPIAIIVCEGDIETIHHITKALKNKLPVIIIKGSGKAADFVLDALENSYMICENAKISLGIELNDSLQKMMKKSLSTIKKNMNLVGIFDLTQDDPLMLSNIVGKAVTNSWTQRDLYSNGLEDDILQTEENTEQFLDCIKKQSAMSRNRTRKAKHSSITSLPLWLYSGYMLLQKSRLMEKYGSDLLLAALKTNQQDYIKLLLEEGVEIKEEYLPELYEQVTFLGEHNCTHIEWILKKIPDEDEYPRHIMVADRAARFCCNLLQYKEERMPNIRRFVSCLWRCKKTSTKNMKISLEDSILLWAILGNNQELAELLWRRGKQCILTGLISSAILKELSKKTKGFLGSLNDDLEKHARWFELQSIDIIEKKFAEDPEEAMRLIDCNAEVWKIESSPLEFAHENFMFDVVAHPCSIRLMNKRWYNNLQPDLKFVIRNLGIYCTAPRTKYIINCITFAVLLLAFSAFVLTSIKDRSNENASLPTRLTIGYVYIWCLTDIMEALLSFFEFPCLDHDSNKSKRSKKRFWTRMKMYFNNFWNVVDLVASALYILADSVNVYLSNDEFTVSRRLYSLSLLVMYLRFFKVFLVHREIGTTLVMIKEMVKDLFQFMLLALLVVLGVGIYYHANLWPDNQTLFDGVWTEWRIWTILYLPYWQLYGEPDLGSLKGSNQPSCYNVTSSTSLIECPQEDWTVPTVAAMYMLFSNILLLSLVIAMFSYTFERIKENSEKLWHFEMYTVINDFEWRPFTPYMFFNFHVFYRLRKKGLLASISPFSGIDNKRRYLERHASVEDHTTNN